MVVNTWQRHGHVRYGSVRRRSSLLSTGRGLSFQDARKIVNSRVVLSGSYAMAAKGKQATAPQLQDAQTQTDVAVQTDIKRLLKQTVIRALESQFKLQFQVQRVPLNTATITKQINLKRSSQIVFLRDLMTRSNSITASSVLMKTWRKALLQNLLISKAE